MADNESGLDLVRNDDAEVSYKIRKIWFPVVIIVSIILLVICIVLAVLYVQALNKHEVSPRTEAPKKYEICDDENCFSLGLKLVKNMNKSVDPCQDFYAYACGGWQERHPLKNNASANYTQLIVMEKNNGIIKKALEQAHLNYSKFVQTVVDYSLSWLPSRDGAKPLYTIPAVVSCITLTSCISRVNVAVMKTVRVYKSCMNTTAIDAQGLQPMKELIAEYGGWSISSNYNPNVTIATRIARAARGLNVDSLIGAILTPVKFNSSINVLMLRPATTGLGRDVYINLNSDSEKKRKSYKKYMKDVSKMFNSSDDKMMSIYDFEVKLAKIASGKDPETELMEHLRKTTQMKANENINFDDLLMPLSLFCKLSGFSWPFLQEILSIIFGRHFSGQEKVLAVPEAIHYFKALYFLYSSTDDSILADYIMWQVFNKYIAALPSNYSSAKEEMVILQQLPRWKICITAMMGPFDMTLGLLYVDAHFNDDSKTTIEKMIENIRSSFIERLPSQTWMDSKTRELAKEKALAIIADIGYPAYIKNPKKLEEEYKSVNVTDSLFANFIAVNHFTRMRNVNKYGIPVDKNKWTFGSPSVWNGYYSPFLNRIVFLAGIIQPPIYSPEYPRYMNYGGIGMVIGHEITHGFDGTGREYDKNGNYRNWWSESSSASFQRKAKCFERQYDKYKVFDEYINGTKTLNENIADNGGIKIAYDAYQRWAAKNKTEKILPGLDLNPNQLFFLGFAQSWCAIYSKKAAYNQLASDVHAFNKYRVIGSLSNFKKFSEAFKCPTNSRMNPSDKCAIW